MKRLAIDHVTQDAILKALDEDLGSSSKILTLSFFVFEHGRLNAELFGFCCNLGNPSRFPMIFYILSVFLSNISRTRLPLPPCSHWSPRYWCGWGTGSDHANLSTAHGALAFDYLLLTSFFDAVMIRRSCEWQIWIYCILCAYIIYFYVYIYIYTHFFFVYMRM